MRLYRGKISVISEEIANTLINDGDIEVEPSQVAEVMLDIESVLKEYMRIDREILEKAKDIVEKRKLDYGQLNRVRQGLAEEAQFGINEHAYDWLIRQLIEQMMHSRNVEEVFAEDPDLRRKIREVLKKHTELESDLDRQVRAKIKNLQEGTQNWDIEYQKVMMELKQAKRLE